MGSTFLGGPVYGAYALLAVVSKENIAASAAALEILQVDIPTDEQWGIMKVAAYCDVQGNAGDVDVEDDGTSILSADIALASDDSVEGTVTLTGGEKARIVEGVLTVDVDNGITTAIEDLTVSIWGFIRKKDPKPSDV